MLPPATLRPFPDLLQLGRLLSAPTQIPPSLAVALVGDDDVERDRAVASLLVADDRPRWVRCRPSRPLEHGRHGGRRHGALSWAQELEVVAELDRLTAAGEVVTARQVADLVAQRTGQPVDRRYAYRLLARHGWLRTRRRS